MEIKWAKNSEFIFDNKNQLIIKNQKAFNRWKMPVKSILVCSKCGSRNVSIDVFPPTIKETEVNFEAWANGTPSVRGTYDYIEVAKCNACEYSKERRRCKQ